MTLHPAFRLIAILLILLAQFLMLITLVNGVVSDVTIQQQIENQITEAARKQNTLTSTIEQELNNQLSQDRDSENVEIINSGSITSWQDIQNNQLNIDVSEPAQQAPAETIIR